MPTMLDPPNLYLRQNSIVGGQGLKKVAIVGCGGVGMWAGYFLALGGVEQLELFDSDTVSDHNLNRLPLTYEHIGKVKSEALADLILAHRPSARANPRMNFDPTNPVHLDALSNCHWVICSTDSYKSRKAVYGAAMDRGCAYLELGVDGDQGSVSYEPPSVITELEDNPGYASVPVFVGPCVIAAAIACYHVMHNQPMYDRTHRFLWEFAENGAADFKFQTLLDIDPVSLAEEEEEGEEEGGEEVEVEDEEEGADAEEVVAVEQPVEQEDGGYRG